MIIASDLVLFRLSMCLSNERPKNPVPPVRKRDRSPGISLEHFTNIALTAPCDFERAIFEADEHLSRQLVQRQEWAHVFQRH